MTNTERTEFELNLIKRFANNHNAAYNYLRSAEFKALEYTQNPLNDSYFNMALELVAEALGLFKYQVYEKFQEGIESWKQN